MSVYAVRLKTQLLTQDCLNVFFYRTPNPGSLEGTASDLNSFFNTSVVAGLKPRVAIGVAFIELYTYDLFFPTNINTQALSGAGSGSGDVMSPFNAYAVRSNRASRAIRRGQKRFPGVIEADVINGVIQVVSLWAGLLATMASPIVGGSSTYTPVIVKRVPYTTSQGTPAYRLPETIAEYQAFDVTSWALNQRVSTQNSRKIPFL